MNNSKILYKNGNLEKNESMIEVNENINDINENFDMLVTFKEDLNEISPEVRGMKEIELILGDLAPNNNGKSNFFIKESEFFNAVKVDLYMDKYEVVQKMVKTPTEVIEKVIPIDTVVHSAADNIIEAILEIATVKIARGESFTVEGMLRSRLDSLTETINNVPDIISQKLNLPFSDKNSDWIIIIEELGEDTGIAICKPDEVLIK